MAGRHRPKGFKDFDIDLGRTGRAFNTTIDEIAMSYAKVWFIENDPEKKEYSFNPRQLQNYSKYLLGECMRLIEEQGMSAGANIRSLQKIKQRFNILADQPDEERRARRLAAMQRDQTDNKKTCPPCHGDCNQGRECPAHNRTA